MRFFRCQSKSIFPPLNWKEKFQTFKCHDDNKGPVAQPKKTKNKTKTFARTKCAWVVGSMCDFLKSLNMNTYCGFVNCIACIVNMFGIVCTAQCAVVLVCWWYCDGRPHTCNSTGYNYNILFSKAKFNCNIRIYSSRIHLKQNSLTTYMINWFTCYYK